HAGGAAAARTRGQPLSPLIKARRGKAFFVAETRYRESRPFVWPPSIPPQRPRAPRRHASLPPESRSIMPDVRLARRSIMAVAGARLLTGKKPRAGGQARLRFQSASAVEIGAHGNTSPCLGRSPKLPRGSFVQ